MENPHRLIPDPLRSHDLTECPVDGPTGKTDGITPVASKRKYAASSTSALVSLSSSGSSPTPPSPGSEVDREDSIPGERLMLGLPRRVQVAKRPRLDSAPSGGSVASSSVQARQTLVPPPVFRRRPPTPFNRPPGERVNEAEGSGYVEGNGNDEVEASGSSSATSSELSSDDSLGNWRFSRQRRVR
jgi:hypothetical protein